MATNLLVAMEKLLQVVMKLLRCDGYRPAGRLYCTVQGGTPNCLWWCRCCGPWGPSHRFYSTIGPSLVWQHLPENGGFFIWKAILYLKNVPNTNNCSNFLQWLGACVCLGSSSWVVTPDLSRWGVAQGKVPKSVQAQMHWGRAYPPILSYPRSTGRAERQVLYQPFY